ncbi:MAG: ABC transporter substrate-binding protein [Betaproteobacteria bacterium]|nr:ABC transporter substrate-binding protein [Betaproteobacteria bacterium]
MSANSPRQLPRLDVVIANNFGHLPMFIGAEKGYFRQHGVDARFKVVDTGTDMVNALHNGEAQIGDMSTTTYLKAVHAGESFLIIGLIMNDATRDNADDPLAIVTRKGRGIEAGKVTDLKGKRIGLARGQTSDEYFKMVLRRAKMKYGDLSIENIWSQFGLAPALAEGKVDAVVTWEPYVSQVLTQVPDSYLVIRGGQHMSYVMVAVAHGPTVETKPALIKSIAAGLAQSSHFTRNKPDEAVEIFAKWVPGTDVEVGKKGIRNIRFDPRMSPNVLRAFENAEDEILMNTLPGAPRLDVPNLFRPQFMAEVEKAHPEYFKDLPALKR